MSRAGWPRPCSAWPTTTASPTRTAAPASPCASPTATWPGWSGPAARTSAGPSGRSGAAASSTTTPTPSACAMTRRCAASPDPAGCVADHAPAVTQGTDAGGRDGYPHPSPSERYRRRQQEEPAGTGRRIRNTAEGSGRSGDPGGVRSAAGGAGQGALARDRPASLARPAPSRPERVWPLYCRRGPGTPPAGSCAGGEAALHPAADGVADGDVALLDEPGDVAVDVQGEVGVLIQGRGGRAEEGDHGHAPGPGRGRRPEHVLGAAAGRDGHQHVPGPAEALDLANTSA